MEPFATLPEMLEKLDGVLEMDAAGSCHIKDLETLRGPLLDRLTWTAVFGDGEIQDAARWIIRAAAGAAGVLPWSIQRIYEVMGQGELAGCTVPAFNLRGATYDMARALFRAARRVGSSLFLCEIARSEMGYTEQRPAEYATCVLAAGLREGWQGPVFIQGDHFQLKAANYFQDPEAETVAIRELCREAIQAGFYNIDIDSSTLVVLERPTVLEQQRDNYERCAELTAYIREIEPAGVTVSVGGEIGEVGGKNSTVEEFVAFMEGFQGELESRRPGATGISKISVQTGTAHGGIPMPDGSIQEVAVDFDVLRDITEVGRRKYAMGGTVQHGASTLPEELFDRFPQYQALEIHLATQFQNLFFEAPTFPTGLREEMYAWIRESLSGEFKGSLTGEQNIYKTRKKAWGPFKHQIWSLDESISGPIFEALEQKFQLLFDKLGGGRTREAANRFLEPMVVPVPPPTALQEALG